MVKHSFSHVRQDVEKVGWVGAFREDGQNISVWGSTALICAEFLNYKCRVSGAPLPNPEVGCREPRTYGKNKTGYRYVSRYSRDGRYQALKTVKGVRMYVSGKNAKEVAMMLNYKCR